MTHFCIFVSMLQKYLTISVNACSLLPFIDEFVHQRLISQISIILLLKNTPMYQYLAVRACVVEKLVNLVVLAGVCVIQVAAERYY